MLSVSNLIVGCGFVGAWLLVAGPLFQGALELHAEDVDREALHRVAKSVPAPERISMWWWLMPPVLYVIKRQRMARYHERTLAALTSEQREKLVSFVNKATGWFMVAGGGALLAFQTTWQLVVRCALPAGSFWVIVAVMLMLCTLNTAARMIHSERVVHPRAP